MVNGEGRLSTMPKLVCLVVAFCLLFTAVACGGDDAEESGASAPMKIGLMLNFSGPPETVVDRKRAFDLAVQHVNEAGGVLGRPVEGVEADTTRDPELGVEAARRLVESESVHAIVGPTASAIALPVAEMVTGPAGVPTISPSATSPLLTAAADDGYFFRTTLSDTAQGPVLARLTGERGFDNVGLVYIDDPYGQGLARSFEESWDGQLRAVPVDREQTDHLADLQESAGGGAQALVVITFEEQALDIVREALDGGIYNQFMFGDAAKRLSLVTEIGGERLGDMYGTAGAPAPENDATVAWEAAFAAAYGGPPQLTYVKETYDATIALALAAQAAGSLNGAAIRDQLRAIGSPPGETVLGTPDGVAEGLRLLAEGRQINYEGAANTLDWDASGDLLQGYIGTWRYTRDGRIEEVEAILFQY